ncbi:MAG TPA: hypothetical protein VGQ92_18175 [Actinoplanes sp.]|nr:hypothetical protein [Actinoplanes sp.]
MAEKKTEQPQKKRTIAELAAREVELMAELAKVRVEISERAGQKD